MTAWARLRRLLRPPRRLRVLRSGVVVITGTLALGFAALNTGNNLLYLLLGALLGLIALSGWLSEQMLRGVRVLRMAQDGTPVDASSRFTYVVEKRRTWLPTHDLEIREAWPDRGTTLPPAGVRVTVPAYVLSLLAGESARVRSAFHAERRGVHELAAVTLATTFPFGLFRKERDIDLPGAVVVWPRTDRPVRPPAVANARGRRPHLGAAAAPSRTRGDYRGLRAYRSGDDRRDIHWRSSARLGTPVVREYEHDTADEYWIVVDTAAPDFESGEAVIEIAAALVVRAARAGDRCGLAAGTARVEPGHGPGRTEGLLDFLAAVQMTRTAPWPDPPVPAGACMLVTARAAAALPWGDVIRVGQETL